MDIAEIRRGTIDEYQKSQTVRLIDVFIIAPILIYTGITYRKSMPITLSIIIIVIGIFTAFYNGKNFLINKKNEI